MDGVIDTVDIKSQKSLNESMNVKCVSIDTQSAHSAILKANKTSLAGGFWIRVRDNNLSSATSPHTYSRPWWAHLMCAVLCCSYRLRSGSAGQARGWAEPGRTDPGRRRQSCCPPDRRSGPTVPLRNRTGEDKVKHSTQWNPLEKHLSPMLFYFS